MAAAVTYIAVLIFTGWLVSYTGSLWGLLALWLLAVTPSYTRYYIKKEDTNAKDSK